jgi:hypothetical protein
MRTNCPEKFGSYEKEGENEMVYNGRKFREFHVSNYKGDWKVAKTMRDILAQCLKESGHKDIRVWSVPFKSYTVSYEID